MAERDNSSSSSSRNKKKIKILRNSLGLMAWKLSKTPPLLPSPPASPPPYPLWHLEFQPILLNLISFGFLLLCLKSFRQFLLFFVNLMRFCPKALRRRNVSCNPNGTINRYIIFFSENWKIASTLEVNLADLDDNEEESRKQKKKESKIDCQVSFVRRIF